MISSMTGYGRSSIQVSGRLCVQEMKSVNHRFLEVNVNLPLKKMRSLESKIKQRLKERFSRGKIDVYIYFNGEENASGKHIRVDHTLARDYLSALQELKNSYELGGKITLENLAQFKDIFVTTEVELGEEEIWEILEKGLLEAISNLEEMRKREGAMLAQDITQHLAYISTTIDEIKERLPKATEDCRNKLKEKLTTLVPLEGLDPYRLEQEVIFWTERSDVSEEITRLASHLGEFLRLMQLSEPIGRNLDFLVQEMHREINTVGSKMGDLLISQKVISIKSELEKIRQQVQNIE